MKKEKGDHVGVFKEAAKWQDPVLCSRREKACFISVCSHRVHISLGNYRSPKKLVCFEREKGVPDTI